MGDNTDRKYRPSRIAGGWAWGWQRHPGKDSCHEIWRSNSRILQPEEASEEGQGPRRAVEPMIMMMIRYWLWLFTGDTTKSLRLSSQRHAQAALTPGKGPSVPIVQKAGWTPEPVWTQEARGKILSPLPGIEPRSPGRPVSTLQATTRKRSINILHLYLYTHWT
jgi:hypothetical protein